MKFSVSVALLVLVLASPAVSLSKEELCTNYKDLYESSKKDLEIYTNALKEGGDLKAGCEYYQKDFYKTQIESLKLLSDPNEQKKKYESKQAEILF